MAALDPKDKTVELALDDISAVIRLVSEVCNRWDDPAGWRQHLLEGACRLLDGNAGTMLTEYEGAPGRFGRISVMSVVGLPAPERNLVEPGIMQLQRRDYEEASQNLLPGLTAIYAQIVKQGWVTTTRNEVSDAAEYHAAPYYRDFRRHIDCDDYVVSIRLVDVPRRPEGITIDRPHGAPPFTAREVALLKLLHDQIAPLIGVRLATEAHLSRDGLSTRLRQTLSLLLEGLGEKQVAYRLNLGHRTVHEYVTMIYKHFQVSSRAELLAYFIRRTPVPRTEIKFVGG